METEIEVSEEAQALHDKALLIDGHNDSIIEHWARKESMDLTPDWPEYQVDLQRMKGGGLTAMNSMMGGQELHQSIELWDGMYEQVEKHPDEYLIVRSVADIHRCKAEGKIGHIGQLESCRCLGNSLHVLHMQHRLGLRVGNLTHGDAGETSFQGTRSCFGYCDLGDREAARRVFSGLTDFAREAIAEMNRLGIAIDTAHTNDAAFFDAVEASATPIEFSHGACFALCPHWRNLTDEQLKALADNGGVIGIVFYRNFLDQDPDKQNLSRVVDHIEHVCEVAGEDHVGFGSDYDGIGASIAIPPSFVETPQLTQLLLDRGFSEEIILKFWGGNFLRLLTEVEEYAD